MSFNSPFAENPMGPLERVQIEAFTGFTTLDAVLSPGLNVILGENGSGKTHFLKLCYAATEPLYLSERTIPVEADDLYHHG